MICLLACVALLVSFAQELYIRVNQLGFAPGDVKTAVVFGNEPLPPEFAIVDAATGNIVLRGRLTPARGGWGQFQQYAELNFSGFTRRGRFVIEVGSARSLLFNIGERTYADVPDQLLDFMRQQRCGYNPFVEAECHTFDGRTAFGPEPPGTYVNATGGWHDAGDPFIWCSNNLAVALATEALLYERMTGDHRYREFAAKQIDWLLERNPWGVSMFTGIPAHGVYPRDVHLFPNVLLHRMVRGGLVDGPVYRKVFQSLRGVSIREPDPLAVFQDERAVYHDDVNDYSTNEPTMDGTASAILLFALR